MKLVLLALYDKKLSAFMTPFFAQSRGSAVRQLADMVNGQVREGQEALAGHPDDFSLWDLGTWSDEGVLMTYERELVVECVNLRAERK